MTAAASRLIPVSIVENMEASLRFYSDTLGGFPIYRYPADGNPTFVSLA